MTRAAQRVMQHVRTPSRATYDAQVRDADALRRCGAHDDALRAFHALTVAFPERSDAFSNLAAMLQSVGHPVPALQAVSRALELDPRSVAALVNSAEILKDFGDWETVVDTYDAALALQPASAELRFARALALLTLGRWREGWIEHEQRAQVPGLPLRRTTLRSPVWDGSALDGRHILLDHEQGLGDQIMFARFASQVAERGGRVTVRCSAPLAALFAAMDGVSDVSVEGSAVPAHEVHASLMSLPALMGITSPEQLSRAPYLRAQGSMSAEMAHALRIAPSGSVKQDSTNKRPRVGLVWSGNPLHRNDARRSLPPALLAPLVEQTNAHFVSLQRLDAAQTFPTAMAPHVTDLGPLLHDCNDTAHALRTLDLLITVDTAVAHLAGALGVRTLLLIPFVPDWRWMLHRADTPWYQSVTLVRQRALFDWMPVLKDVHTHVAALVGAHA
jgi:hypothetical protein